MRRVPHRLRARGTIAMASSRSTGGQPRLGRLAQALSAAAADGEECYVEEPAARRVPASKEAWVFLIGDPSRLDFSIALDRQRRQHIRPQDRDAT